MLCCYTDFADSLSLSICPNHPLLPPGLLNCLLHPCRAVVGNFFLAHPCIGVYKRMSLISSSLLLLKCRACLVHLSWMVLKMGGKWSNNHCFMGYCFQDLFIITHCFLVQFLSSFFSIRFVNVHVVYPYSSIKRLPWQSYTSSIKKNVQTYCNR